MLQLKFFFQMVSYLIAIGFVIHFFNENGGIGIFETLSKLNLNYILIAVLLLVISIFLGTKQWQYILKLQNNSASFFSLFRIVYLSLFFNSVLFSIFGDVAKVHKLKRVGVSVFEGIFSSVLDRFFNFFALVCMLFGSCLFAYFEWMDVVALKKYFWMSLCFFVGSFSLLLFSFFSYARKFIWNFIQKIVRWNWLLGHLKKIKKKGFQFNLSHSIKSFLILWVFSLGTQALRVGSFFFAVLALDVYVSPIYLLCFVPLISFLVILPFNIGGWGLPQTIGIELFSLAGVVVTSKVITSELIASVVVLPGLIYLLVNLFGGIFLFSKIKLHTSKKH